MVACGSRYLPCTCRKARARDTQTSRSSSTALNAGSGHEHQICGGFKARREYRIGRWGVETVTARGRRRRSRGTGGENLRLMLVDVIAALPAGFDAATDCAVRGPADWRAFARSADTDKRDRVHGAIAHDRCFARRVGYVVDAWPVCRHWNV